MKEETFATESEQQGTNSDIKINTEVLKERRDTYVSLSDLYQISIFTNQAFAQAELLKKEKQEKDQILYDSVFVKHLSQTKEQDLQSVLFIEMTGETKKQDYSVNQSGNKWIYTAVLLLVSLIFICILQRYNYYRKKRREHDVNDYNLETAQGSKN